MARSAPSAKPAPARRASPPRVPPRTRALERAEKEREEYIQGRERMERRSVLRGLLLFALIVLLASIFRAGLGRVFPHGWWRP